MAIHFYRNFEMIYNKIILLVNFLEEIKMLEVLSD